MPNPRARSSRGGVEEAGGVAEQRRLDQHPAAAGRAVRDRVELAVAQRGHVVVRQLGAGLHLERHARARSARPATSRTRAGSSARMPRASRSRTCGVTVTSARAVGHGEPGELDGVVEVDRAVVDLGQQVEVELGALHGPLTVTHGPRRL